MELKSNGFPFTVSWANLLAANSRAAETRFLISALFSAELAENFCIHPFERDLYMEESVWMPLDEAEKQNINPAGIAAKLRAVVEAGETVYLGTRIIAEVE